MCFKISGVGLLYPIDSIMWQSRRKAYRTAIFANNLTPAAGRPVRNKTGPEGRYFCAVTFIPLAAQTNDNPADVVPPNIFEVCSSNRDSSWNRRKLSAKFWLLTTRADSARKLKSGIQPRLGLDSVPDLSIETRSGQPPR